MDLRHELGKNGVEVRWRMFVEIELDLNPFDNCNCWHRVRTL